MKNTIILILAVLLLLSGAGNIIQIKSANTQKAYRDAERIHNQDAMDKVRENAHAQITQLQARGDSLQKKVVRDSLAAKSKIGALSGRISAQSQVIATLRGIAEPKIDENPEIGDLITAQDIQLGNLDSLVKAQELACFNQIADMRQIQLLQERRLEEVQALGELEKQRGDAEEKEKNKAKRGRKFWQVVAAGAGAVIAILSLK